MTLLKKNRILPIVTVIAVTLFFGCESNFKEVQKINFSEFVPTGDADDINLKYTDSGRIKAILVSSKMLEFGSVDFPFSEFPKGIDVTLYDNKGKKTFIKSDYAVSYKLTNSIDLKGNVKITSQDGQILETEQLYFDQKNDWFFTEKNFKFTDPKGVSNGQGIDFSKDFKVINSQKIIGEVETVE
ncbi:LPS export ABC transporter periplasmic protein LptC [uncultured Flavobacterium sp.]|jgi:LPS export ABC transporter protein LptC|uniref:LPS export ABC transporter periplasmic protein LptC n=1 Tax=uncultured Flavobacterium sp. TaxID=165435 RepID=UPI0030CA2D6F